jgi:septal ring factor EnvC (AmiA/AmiB activator)
MKKSMVILITCIPLVFLCTQCNPESSHHTKDDIAALGKRIDELDSHIAELNNQLDEAINQISGFETMISELEEQIDKNARMVDYLEDQINRIQYDLN